MPYVFRIGFAIHSYQFGDYLNLSVCVVGFFSPYLEQHKRYDSSKSKQYKRDNRKFHITYGTGEVSGFTSIDSVTVRDAIKYIYQMKNS